MKNQQLIKTVIIVLASFYLITVIERTLLKTDSSTEIMIEHASEKMQMQTKIELLNNKLHNYELQILKIDLSVDSLSNNEIDSVWTSLFSTQ